MLNNENKGLLIIADVILYLFGILVWFSDGFSHALGLSGFFTRFFAGLVAIIIGIIVTIIVTR